MWVRVFCYQNDSWNEGPERTHATPALLLQVWVSLVVFTNVPSVLFSTSLCVLLHVYEFMSQCWSTEHPQSRTVPQVRANCQVHSTGGGELSCQSWSDSVWRCHAFAPLPVGMPRLVPQLCERRYIYCRTTPLEPLQTHMKAAHEHPQQQLYLINTKSGVYRLHISKDG